ncbi:DUF6241 domain-containing protein [Bacillus sp. FJAT-45066]|uniref:DUF6241 domain-containing protein n=1 Tax=Bacillus sp. FJAT-45066 TaxID=2011010 RepID=UPI000BB72A25|nr:DUF6241 domain-containing protein [Bacillus sp. FJAT-45066]
MNRLKALVVIGAICIGMLVFFVFFMGDSNFFKADASEEEVVVTEESKTVDEVPVETEVEVDEEALTQVEIEFPFTMSEGRVKDAIHHMSHGWIWAAQKRGHLEATQERIDRLLIVVKENHEKYENAELYEEILTRWQAGDFSKAVRDHNAVWTLLEGEVGKALRLLTKEERKEYAKMYYNR